MPRLLRKYSKGEVYFVTNRTAEGLPFVANLLINTFINGILARALVLHPGIELSAYLVMPNHYHLILVLNEGAEVLKSFMGYVDGELAKVINRFRGRCNQNVWASRYHAQAILTPEAVLEKMKYIYMNPSVADLVDSVSKYPGVNSWKNLIKNHEKFYRFYGSANLSKLPYGPLPKKVMNSIIEKKSKSKKFTEKNLLRVNPFGWAKCFSSYQDKDPAILREELIAEVKEEEAKLQKRRNGKVVLGAQNLISQCFHKHFKSKKYQKRSLCISTCLLIRQQYLEAYRDFVTKCQAAYSKFKEDFTNVHWPPGAFPPSRVPMSSSIQLET